MAYTTQAKVANYLKRDLSDNEIALLPTIIAGIKKVIDRMTYSTFDSASSTDRDYDGGVQYVDIDPCTTVTVVSLVDDYGTIYYTLQTYEYVLEPKNETVKRQIRYRWGKLPYGASRVRVTAQYSQYDNGVPEDIQMITTKLCAAFLNNKSANGIKREALEGHLVEFDFTNVALQDPLVLSVIDSYKQPVVD